MTFDNIQTVSQYIDRNSRAVRSFYFNMSTRKYRSKQKDGNRQAFLDMFKFDYNFSSKYKKQDIK